MSLRVGWFGYSRCRRGGVTQATSVFGFASPKSFAMAQNPHVIGDEWERDIMRIAVIGTGVAGSLLAEMLQGHRGITLDAFDRLAPGEEAEAGTGLNVGPNAMKALRLHLPQRHAAANVMAKSYYTIYIWKIF